MILSIATRTSTAVANYANDVDTLEFLKELREEIMDQYITLLMSASDTNHKGLFEEYLDNIFDFLEQTCNIESKFDLKIIKLIVSLVGDIATHFPKHQSVQTKATKDYIEKGILVL